MPFEDNAVGWMFFRVGSLRSLPVVRTDSVACFKPFGGNAAGWIPFWIGNRRSLLVVRTGSVACSMPFETALPVRSHSGSWIAVHGPLLKTVRCLFQVVRGGAAGWMLFRAGNRRSLLVVRTGFVACSMPFETALPVGYHSGSEIDVRCLLFGTVPWLAPCRSGWRCRLDAISGRESPFTARCSRRSVACFRSFGRRCRFDGAAACSILFGALTV